MLSFEVFTAIGYHVNDNRNKVSKDRDIYKFQKFQKHKNGLKKEWVPTFPWQRIDVPRQ